jgi:formylglycine-generating enzyme required for sulfatase activity
VVKKSLFGAFLAVGFCSLAVLPARAADMAVVTIADAGNTADANGYGRVTYAYSIGKHEVTNEQYAEFLNAVAAQGDPRGLYNSGMSGQYGGITRTGSGTAGDPYHYAVRSGAAAKPVNYVSYYDSLRFANWLHNGRPVGGQTAATTEDGAYDLAQGSSVVRKPTAAFFLPTENEWYKAAYYKGGGLNAGYWAYATRSNTAPNCYGAPVSNDSNAANYWGVAHVGAPSDAGAYGAAVSPYGTLDQNGNVSEWNESLINTYRGTRGGSWEGAWNVLQASVANSTYPSYEGRSLGFRVGAAVPEPATALFLAIGGAAIVRRRRPV